MRVATGYPVSQAVIAPLVVLLQDCVKVSTVGVHCPVYHARQIAETPVRPDKADRSPGNRTANQGIDHAGQGNFKPFTQQVKAEQHQQRNEHGGVGVLHVAKREEQHAGDHNQDQLTFNGGHEIEHRKANRDADQRADNTQRKTVSGGVIVRLADEQAGQQDPVAVVQPGYLDKGIPHAQHQRHSYRVAKECRLRRKVTAQT